MREIEIHPKLNNAEISNFKLALKKEKFKDHGKTTQIDYIFNNDCFKNGVKFRLRVENDSASITTKTKTNYKTGLQNRKEINIDIPKHEVKKYLSLFKMIGYDVFYQVIKMRHIFKKGNIEIVFDKWPLIDELIEIEGPKKEIEEFVNKFLPKATNQTSTYKELIKQKIKSTGKSFKALVKDFEIINNFKLINIDKIFDGQ